MHRFMLLVGMGTALLAGACADEPDTPMGAAASRNDAAEIRRLLAAGKVADQMGRQGMTPVMSAARAGALDAMRALLDAGADPNQRDGRVTGWPPLMHAIHKGQLAAVGLLLERGADANRGTGPPFGFTPLLMAAADSNPSFVTLLLTHGADPRVRTWLGTTALTQAVSAGALQDIDRPLLGGCHTATVRALLAHDPDLQLPSTPASHEALFWARFHDCAEVLKVVRIEEKPPER